MVSGYLKHKLAREYQREILKLRDGYKCQICGLSGSEIELVVHHIDGNIRNNNVKNLSFLCRSDNAKEQHRLAKKREAMAVGTSKNMREREKITEENMDVVQEGGTISLLNASAEIKMNRIKEPSFRKWILDQLLSNPEYKYGMLTRDVINGGAEKFSCSPITTRRYLSKMISRKGMYRQIRNANGHSMIQLKFRLNEESKILGYRSEKKSS